MFKYNKAVVAALGSGITGLLLASTDLPQDTVAALGTLITTVLTWLIPNKE